MPNIGSLDPSTYTMLGPKVACYRLDFLSGVLSLQICPQTLRFGAYAYNTYNVFVYRYIYYIYILNRIVFVISVYLHNLILCLWYHRVTVASTVFLVCVCDKSSDILGSCITVGIWGHVILRPRPTVSEVLRFTCISSSPYIVYPRLLIGRKAKCLRCLY